ncbi:H-NS histone family protein [Bordetella hinzii]|jgi:DNA-binding protein H-NS|uniref:H-NS histone family protein n=1 Tax=Bordetella hinzii TaxID=103855 RepID=UPI00045A234C|nr:H-NS histone family protein [Bordetella hinzii]KCB47951.1 H-NS histone family protein [Bordetella hinzii 4161]KXA74441.1 hypothetical protein AXA74_03185 [Bordetella hinzii LMG 13501]QDJ35723.1 hypothetical protein CBR67_03150 [Bordetella hinzii]VEH32029.1 hns-like transcription regulator protein [Bordetella hinzii]
MATYLELKAKAEKLLQEAEELRQKEMAEVINEIKQKMAEYGISTADLGASKKGGVKKSAGSAPVKYRGPNGEEWSGRGRSPQWLANAIEGGKKKEDFAV